jgi:hypothetical protein
MPVSRLCFEAGGPSTRVDRLGHSRSQHGVAIVSNPFLEKRWTREELNDLATGDVAGKKASFPVWHNVGFREIRDFSPGLADRVAISME